MQGRYVKLPYFEGYILACPTDYLGRRVFQDGVYERQVIAIIREYVSQGFHYVDVGANIGLHTIAAALCRPSAEKVLAVEPEPTVFSILEKNVKLNNLPNVVYKEAAIGEESSTKRLYISGTQNSGNHSLIPRERNALGPVVQVLTANEVLYEEFPDSFVPVLVKIDAEGYEPKVIRGGSQWLSEASNVVLILEVSPVLLAEQDESVEDLLAILEWAGFKGFHIIRDTDSIDGENNLVSDYFTILLKKGKIADTIFRTLSSDLFVKVEKFQEFSSYRTLEQMSEG